MRTILAGLTLTAIGAVTFLSSAVASDFDKGETGAVFEQPVVTVAFDDEEGFDPALEPDPAFGPPDPNLLDEPPRSNERAAVDNEDSDIMTDLPEEVSPDEEAAQQLEEEESIHPSLERIGQ